MGGTIYVPTASETGGVAGVTEWTDVFAAAEIGVAARVDALATSGIDDEARAAELSDVLVTAEIGVGARVAKLRDVFATSGIGGTKGCTCPIGG